MRDLPVWSSEDERRLTAIEVGQRADHGAARPDEAWLAVRLRSFVGDFGIPISVALEMLQEAVQAFEDADARSAERFCREAIEVLSECCPDE